MISPQEETPDDGPGLVFATLWATGSDPRHDGVFRLQALRRSEERGWESFERTCRPFEEGAKGADPEGATRRMLRDYGVRSEELRDADAPEQAWVELVDFCAGHRVVAVDRAALETWGRHFGAAIEETVLELRELTALLTPGREAAGARVGSSTAPPLAVEPEDLQAAALRVVAHLCGREREVLALVLVGYRQALESLRDEVPEVAGRLELALDLVLTPTLWAQSTGELFVDEPGTIEAGVRDVLAAPRGRAELFQELSPRWSTASAAWIGTESVPPNHDEAAPLGEEEVAAVERAFTEVLPRLLADGGRPSYREGQHEVAAEIAGHLGQSELFLVHAPTGTGKTLAYLVPSILWAARRGVRLGVATYTRALQEQAMDRDVPLAIQCLREIAPELRPRVALLKGRANYLCWRSLGQQLPTALDEGWTVFVWTHLCLFALTDADGDLDRITAPPFLGSSGAQAHAKLVGLVRARTECCSSQRDRDTCASQIARKRAERAHVVLTNHSFALARQEFFRHLVFDECEHLHDGAQQAWSHILGFHEIDRLLQRLYRRGPAARTTPLGRLAAAAGLESMASTDIRAAIDRTLDCVHKLVHLEEAARDFEAWRSTEESAREARDLHAMFEEYVLEQDSQLLLGSHAELCSGMSELSIDLTAIVERLESIPVRNRGRIRRSLEILRGELDDCARALEAWIPRSEHGVRFDAGTFHDVERDGRGRLNLVARVLLPHEHLGRHYYPQLISAAFLSATTFLKQGFEASTAYLGLERAANPATDEEWREPCKLRTFRAPETFDYSRVVVACPKDAASARDDKSAFLDYVSRFVAYLGERTRGRALVLFTNADDCRQVGKRLVPFFAKRGVPFWFQRMDGVGKEELGDRFRRTTDSILLGLDTFWYGADFPGETLEYLVLVKLPYGVPDRYHWAQCARIGRQEQRRSIYMPRALAKFRQGFGRLMRKESDRGCVFLLDNRVLDPRHRTFLRELPLSTYQEGGAPWIIGDTERGLHEAFSHMEMLTEIRRRGLQSSFAEFALDRAPLEAPDFEPDSTLHTDVPF